MNTLFISFLIAIGSAAGLVTLSRTFDLEMYTSRIFPLIPILYAIVYEALEKRRTGKSKPIPPSQAKAEMKAGVSAIFKNITVERVIVDVGISMCIKFTFEVILTAAHLYATKQSFAGAYGAFSVETMGRLLRGDHPWISGNWSIVLLALIALTASLGTGIWIGTTTRGNAILEGVMAGAAVTVISTMTNLLALYRAIEELTVQAADYMGYVTHLGFVVVMTLQVLFYGLWSGIAQRAKEERAAAALEPPARKKK
ncbi:MAG: hypothetical protein OEW15_10560 [Nitrospirota bacterium]|nr:hypothetical protein [Nitrospirota bacterium]